MKKKDQKERRKVKDETKSSQQFWFLCWREILRGNGTEVMLERVGIEEARKHQFSSE